MSSRIWAPPSGSSPWVDRLQSRWGLHRQRASKTTSRTAGGLRSINFLLPDFNARIGHASPIDNTPPLTASIDNQFSPRISPRPGTERPNTRSSWPGSSSPRRQSRRDMANHTHTAKTVNSRVLAMVSLSFASLNGVCLLNGGGGAAAFGTVASCASPPQLRWPGLGWSVGLPCR